MLNVGIRTVDFDYDCESLLVSQTYLEVRVSDFVLLKSISNSRHQGTGTDKLPIHLEGEIKKRLDLMWEMSNYNNTGGGGGFSSTDIIQDHHHYGGNRHSTISFQSGDMSMNIARPNSLGKFPIGVGGGGMLGMMGSKAPLLSAATAGGGLPLNSVPGLNPDVELAVEWSPEEQSILEDGLSKYSDEPNILKYIKISATLPEKTVRDVALRCRWMTKKENGKRRKSEEFYTGKKMKDRKEKQESSSSKSSIIPPAPPLNMGTYNPIMMHQNDRISSEGGLGGPTRHLLDENAQVFSHITANFATYKIQENIDLFCRSRNNIVAIMNDMRAMPGIMSQMPPLPVSINDELANIILPPNNSTSANQAMIYGSAATMYGKPPERRC